MTQISALPTLSVQIAFNPTTLYSTTQTWTDVTQYVRDFQTKSGRQHFLDRIESGTLQMTVTNRTGYFSQTGTLALPRIPIKVTATWSGTTYPIFWGIIDAVTEKMSDALNVDLDIQASDLTKYLSLKYLNNPKFWAGYCTPPSNGGTATSATNWYDCNITQQANVVAASCTSTVITYSYAPGNTTIFTTGQNVSVSGLNPVGGGTFGYNYQNLTVTGTGTGYFTATVSSAPNGQSAGTGSAMVTTIPDLVGTSNGTAHGIVSFTTNGAVIYEVNTALDTASGSSTNTNGALIVPNSSTTVGGVDLWVLGTNQMNYITAVVAPYLLGTTVFQLGVNPQNTLTGGGSNLGYPYVVWGGTNYFYPTGAGAHPINDGYWHHVGIVLNESNQLCLYCDGYFWVIGGGTLTGPIQNNSGVFQFGINPSTLYIDEVVVSNNSSLSTLAGEVQRRFIAGRMLQDGFPTTANNVYSGDRIAEILTLAGWGSVTGGSSTAQATISLNNTLYIGGNGVLTPWTSGGFNGSQYVEPYYWDSPITGSTALDLIQQVTDTDIGSFFQNPDGTFVFFTQAYYGTWTWNSSTNAGTWTLASWTTPSTQNTWTDNNAGTPYLYNSLQVLKDDADLWTTVKVTPQAGTDQVFENTSAEQRYGYTTLTKSGTLHTSLNLALSTATYLGFLYQAPLPRVQNVDLGAEVANGAHIPSMLSPTIGTPINFQRTPAGATGAGIINSNMVVESIAHDFQAEPGQWHTSFTLDPYPLPASITIPFSS